MIQCPVHERALIKRATVSGQKAQSMQENVVAEMDKASATARHACHSCVQVSCMIRDVQSWHSSQTQLAARIAISLYNIDLGIRLERMSHLTQISNLVRVPLTSSLLSHAPLLSHVIPVIYSLYLEYLYCILDSPLVIY
jgi:hypothetical protein